MQVKGRRIHLEEILIGNGYGETVAKVAEVLNSHKERVKTTNLLADIVYNSYYLLKSDLKKG